MNQDGSAASGAVVHPCYVRSYGHLCSLFVQSVMCGQMEGVQIVHKLCMPRPKRANTDPSGPNLAIR